LKVTQCHQQCKVVSWVKQDLFVRSYCLEQLNDLEMSLK